MFTLMEVLKSLAPFFTAAVVVVLSPIVKDLIPAAIRNCLFSIYQDYFFPKVTMTIDHVVLIFTRFGRLIGRRPYPQTMFTLMEVLKSLAPFFTAAVVVVLGPIVKDLIPAAVRNYLFSIHQDYFFPQVTMTIEESCYPKDQIYEAVTTYLCKKVSDSSPKPKRFKCRKTNKQKKPIFDILEEEEFIDNFGDIKLKWTLHEKDGVPYDGGPAKKYFKLSFDKRYDKEVLESYIPHLVARAEEIRKEDKVVMLYSRGLGRAVHLHSGGEWSSMILEHPATFAKLAMDPELQSMLKDDLDRFVKRKDWYKKVGRAWKRGYLIYGPPGTGKSTLIAAMANYLKFDIYDLDISSIHSDSELKTILLSTSNGSILLIEDIDCAKLEKRGQELKYSSDKFTLSGFLNVIDGLWSSCGDERIIVFTTNRKDDLERLDPALFRPGRMDVHVSMSYCTMYGFKKLASTYLGVNDDQLYGQIERLLGNLDVTPAEIAEELSRSEYPNIAFRGVVEYLEKKKELVNAIST